MSSPFVHLRLHSEYSIVDGLVRIDDAVAAAAADGQPALALTDLLNTFGAVRFYKAARSKGVQPLLGAEIRLGREADREPLPRMLLLVQNAVGYRNLCELLSRAWLANSSRAQAAVDPDWFTETSTTGRALHEGLIVLSGATLGEVGQLLCLGTPTALAKAEQVARHWQTLLGDRFYLEVQRAGLEGESEYLQGALPLAARLGLPLVATHPIQFLRPDDFEAHEARVCIAEGETLANPKRPKRFTRQQFFLSQAEMAERFRDLPSALENTAAIARRCSLELQLGKPQLPDFPTPHGESLEEFLRAESRRGLELRLQQCFPDPALRETRRAEYEARLELECDTIIRMGFPGYFLIVADFINWAKRNGVPVGPGRGSGAGSLVAYSLGITDLDPLPYSLLFERFLNPERVSMPDFDIDFCQEKRQRVIEYVRHRYGSDAVSQIVTFGTMASKAVIRDVGRVLDLPYNFCDQLSKLIPVVQNKPLSLQEAREKEPILAEREEKEDEVRELLALAGPLEDMVRNVGMHAGGVLIAPGRLTDFCPLYQAPDAEGGDGVVSMYDKDDVEAVGLVKFDFLGLRNLTILDYAVAAINRRHPERQERPLRLEDLGGFDDPAAYEILRSGNTTAIFQVESAGMKRYLLKLKPDQFEDIIAMLALYRPGPLNSGMVDDFILRKHGQQTIDTFHPDLAECLAPTYGVIVYQEQVMQIAQIMAGYTLGGADLLRRAMGKKKPEEMAQQRSIFMEGAQKKGHPAGLATQLFDLMEKFAEYGFNKSHTAAYAVITYQTAWLKAHYPAEFMAATLSADRGDTDKVAFLVADCRANGLRVLPPDVQASSMAFEASDELLLEARPGRLGRAGAIRYGLGAVRGVGESAVEELLRARAEAGGRFGDLFSLVAGIDRRILGRRTLEALVKAGACDSLHPLGAEGRAALLAGVPLAYEAADQAAANAAQAGLFGDDLASGPGLQLPRVLPWTPRERLLQEKSALGYCLTGSLFDPLAPEVRRFASTRLADVRPGREPIWISGVVSGSRAQMTRRGMMRIIELDDGTARLEVVVGTDLYDSVKALLKVDEALLAAARIDNDEFSGGLRGTALEIQTLAQARARSALGVEIRLQMPGQPSERPEWLERLRRGLAAAREAGGEGQATLPVLLRLRDPLHEACCTLQLGPAFAVAPREPALECLRAEWGVHAVRVAYPGD